MVPIPIKASGHRQTELRISTLNPESYAVFNQPQYNIDLYRFFCTSTHNKGCQNSDFEPSTLVTISKPIQSNPIMRLISKSSKPLIRLYNHNFCLSYINVNSWSSGHSISKNYIASLLRRLINSTGTSHIMIKKISSYGIFFQFIGIQLWPLVVNMHWVARWLLTDSQNYYLY